MGFWNRVMRGDAVRVTQQLAEVPRRSPWTGQELTKIVWSDIYGRQQTTISRSDAMRVPSIVKGRALIIGALARQPLVFFRDDEKQDDPPAWLYRTDTEQSPITRMTWTLDDLIFHGRSLWAVNRDDQDQITDAMRLPYEWWTIDETGQILAQPDATSIQAPVQDGAVIMFESSQEGLCDIAESTVTGALNQDRAWQERVKTPIPLVELHEDERDTEIDDDEAKELVKKWEAARASGGATAFTPFGISAKIHTSESIDLFVNGRNALRLDVANFLNVPASLLDGSVATASLTYSTQEGRRNELLDYCLTYWTLPIEARLSMDDVTEKGTRIAFDVEYYATAQQPSQTPARKD